MSLLPIYPDSQAPADTRQEGKVERAGRLAGSRQLAVLTVRGAMGAASMNL